MGNMGKKILVIENDPSTSRFIEHTLELEGYQVVKASNGKAAPDIFDEEAPDLILLDIRLPGMDGYTVCRHIREFSQVPIIMVTVKGNDEEKIEGLEVGADDYVTKPFSSKELVARVRAVLRRTELRDKRPEPAFQSEEDLVVDYARHRVSLGGEEINLTATEYRLLSYLARNADRVVTLGQILGAVWGEEYIGEPHLVQVNMARLRQKLGDNAKSPKYILTQPGVGYKLVKKT